MRADTPTYWRGSPAPARRVRVRIADTVPSGYWCAGLAGTERDGLEVDTPEGKVLIDNENDVGWSIITSMYRSGGGWSRFPAGSSVIAERSITGSEQ